MSEKFKPLHFGLNRDRPALKNAWGARAIVDSTRQTPVFSIVHNRQGAIAEDEERSGVKEIVRRLKDDDRWRSIQAGALEAFEDGRLSQTKDRESTTLYRDDGLVVMGNCNSSHGYLYLVAWRPGLDEVVEEEAAS